MPPLFPPWSNHALRACIGLGLAVAVGIPALLLAYVRSPWVTGQYEPGDQPVQFDHRHHVRDDGIPCGYCHTEATRGRYAAVPPASLCMNCHAQIWPDAPLLAPVRRAYAGGESLRWRRIHRLPGFVYFQHAVHVDRGVGCETCHGRVDLMAQVYAVAPLTMAWCVDCHRAPTRYLREPARAMDMGYSPRPGEGAAVREALQVAPPVNCSGCHR